MKDFYYILGTDADCTLLEVKEAYKKRAKKFYADLNQGENYLENHFKEIQEAYETLADPRKRRQYDKALQRFKSNSLNGEQKNAKRQYKYHSSNQKPIKRGLGVSISIMLIVMALIIGAYMAEWLFSSKKKTFVAASPNSVTVVKIHKHHLIKHHLNSLVADSDTLKTNNTLANGPVKPVPGKPNLTKPIIIKPAHNNTTLVSDKNANSSGVAYTTYVHPNATGIVNMRKSDTYSSDVIEKIPANSRVLVMEKGNMYYKISYNNAVGYVPKWTVETK